MTKYRVQKLYILTDDNIMISSRQLKPEPLTNYRDYKNGKAFNQVDLMNVSCSGLIIRLQGHCFEVHSPLKEGIQIVRLAY